VLYRAGQDLSLFPLRERRKHLEEVIAGHDLVLPARRLAANGLEAWAQVLERGYKGYVGKDEASQYLGGGPTPRVDGSVCGWRSEGRQAVDPALVAVIARHHAGRQRVSEDR
jgi:hypothetical protein